MAQKLSAEVAGEIVRFLHTTTGYHSIVCDTTGTIIADSAGSRIGVVHAGSQKINGTPRLYEIAVTREEAERNPTMKEGLNLAILLDGEKIGTFGIAGDVAIVTPLAKMAAATVASQLKEKMHKEAVGKMVDLVSDHFQQGVAILETLSSSANKLAVIAKDIADNMGKITTGAAGRTGDTDDILDISQNIAVQTRLLGINASVEAVRAGASGHGFKVIAGEIQKLSQDSSDATKKIKAMIAETQGALTNMHADVGQAASIAHDQANAIQEIADILGQTNSTISELAAIFKR